MEFEFSEQLSGTNCRPMFDRSGKCRKEISKLGRKKSNGFLYLSRIIKWNLNTVSDQCLPDHGVSENRMSPPLLFFCYLFPSRFSIQNTTEQSLDKNIWYSFINMAILRQMYIYYFLARVQKQHCIHSGNITYSTLPTMSKLFDTTPTRLYMYIVINWKVGSP